MFAAVLISVVATGEINVIVHDDPMIRVVVHDAPAKATPRYPVHGDVKGVHWPYSRMSNTAKVAHLAGQEHAGLFDPQWLATLTEPELNSLHEDHHTGRVQWAYVVKPAGVATQNFYGQCANGVCPSPSIFRRRR